ncbi:Glutathionyl-hydroquinone reductase YqjG [Streptomyces sp. YIM 130001]|uniref:glutathione S-transferase C-terminal domain-containing protein n=1 Tax=Streptomyces sp. YIM 130001 TaxID=2259644 RepID=UPI000E659609|nr:glutathione S-transferase C-terminal domain-containing protein [Streptomyces sp. YIM 130001]RII09359.1 Glutathionyl-hydroquinone reductase YqjG [Streptomyces sp. YIM 130001]
MSATYPTAAPSLRSRIGSDPRGGGYYAAPRRYRLHLSLPCPHSLAIAVAHRLLRLDDALPVTLLPAVPDAPDGGYLALDPLYEASAHHHPGPSIAPVLSDTWSGRIVSTHAPDILRDLARRFGGDGPDLHPSGAEDSLDQVGRLCEQVGASARLAGRSDAGAPERHTAVGTLLDTLSVLETRLTSHAYVTPGGLTLADIQLWATLVQLDTVHRPRLSAETVRRIAENTQLWAYARRLAQCPEFGGQLDPDGIEQRRRASDPQAPGAGVPLVDWTAYTSAATAREVPQWPESVCGGADVRPPAVSCD